MFSMFALDNIETLHGRYGELCITLSSYDARRDDDFVI